MNAGPIVFATASTREKMIQFLCAFYCTDKATFDADGFVSNGNRVLDHVRVVPHKTGFKFQSL